MSYECIVCTNFPCMRVICFSLKLSISRSDIRAFDNFLVKNLSWTADNCVCRFCGQRHPRYHFQTPGDTLVVTLIMFLLLLIMYGSIRIYNSIKTLLCLYDFLKKKLNADAEAETFFGPRLNQVLNTGKSLNLSETDSWPKKGSSDSTNLWFHLKK